jgi:hypothetical protein
VAGQHDSAGQGRRAGGVWYGGTWAVPGERGPTREKKRSEPSPDEQ